MPGEHRPLHERAFGREPFGLGRGDGGQRHLGELGEVEQALWVVVAHAARDEFARIVAYQSEDREAELFASVLVGALPHGPRRGRLVALVQSHPLGLHALPRIQVGGARGGHGRRRSGRQNPVDGARNLEGQASVADASDAFDAHVDDVAQRDHSEHPVRPPQNPRSRDLLGHVLRGRAQPHAVDDRLVEPGELRPPARRVNRVVVARDDGEGGHVRRRGDLGRAEDGARGVDDVADPRPGLGILELFLADAAAQGETVGEEGDLSAVAVQDPGVDADDSARGGVGDAGHMRGRSQRPSQLVERHCDALGVIEVDCR